MKTTKTNTSKLSFIFNTDERVKLVELFNSMKMEAIFSGFNAF